MLEEAGGPGVEDSPVLDYQSEGAPYGLIHNVFGDSRRARKLSHNSAWNKKDVWLEDGNLLVLKGGVLNGDENTKYKSNHYSKHKSNHYTKHKSNQYTKLQRYKSKFKPSSRVIFKKPMKRKSDRGWETRDYNLEAAQTEDLDWLSLLGLNLNCLVC